VKDWLQRTDKELRPVPGRLRASWIVAWMREGATPEELVAWAGVARGETLAKYLQFVPEIATESLRRSYLRVRAAGPGMADA
jgi:hypothetical protein